MKELVALRLPVVLLVAAGGAAGTVARLLIGRAFPVPAEGFPWTTLLINAAGSLLLGVVSAHESLGAGARVALAVGVCGGFTTFSTFGLETWMLLEAGATGRAVLYVLASAFLSVVAVAAGRALVG